MKIRKTEPETGTRAHTVPRFYLQSFVAPESEAAREPFIWVGWLATGEIKRRSPKNVSIRRGLYDGPGGFEEPDVTIEAHLAKIESAASLAIRRLASGNGVEVGAIPPEIWRFIAWQAARTAGWIEVERTGLIIGIQTKRYKQSNRPRKE